MHTWRVRLQYGVVRVAEDKATGLRYAIKSISKTRAQQDRHDYAKRILTEVRALSSSAGATDRVPPWDGAALIS